MSKAKKQNKKAVTLLAIMSVIVVMAVGGILAYLTDTDKKENKFTIGNVDIELREATWQNAITTDENEDTIPDGDLNQNGIPDFAETIQPGQTITKDPKVANVGKNDAYVYAKVYVPLVTEKVAYIDGTHTAGVKYQNVELFSLQKADGTAGPNTGWTEMSSGRTTDGKYNVYIYKYNTALAPNAETPTLFDKVTMANMDAEAETIQRVINSITETKQNGDKVVTVKVEAYAIQADGGVTQNDNEIVTTMTTATGETIGAGEILEGTVVTALSSATVQLGGATVGNDPFTLLVGDEKAITLPASAEDVTYESSNTSVATVDNSGNIEVVGAGTATITITGADSGATKTITINAKESVETATVKVGDTTVGNENIKLAPGATKAITVENGEDVTYASSNTSVATVDANGNLTVLAGATTGQTSTITLTGATSGEERTFTVEVKAEVTVGSTISYTTTLNNTEYTADWKVFHKDGDYVYLILSDVLPNSYVNISGISKNGSYNVYGSDRTTLINAMTNTANWNSLLAGTINGNTFDYTSSTDTNIKAMGSPTLDLFVDSWNAKYGTTNRLYTAQNATGYFVGTSENPTTYYTNIGTSDGLYVLNSASHNYWLASPSANYAYSVMRVNYSGNVYYDGYDNTYIAFRPVVCLPSSVLD